MRLCCCVLPREELLREDVGDAVVDALPGRHAVLQEVPVLAAWHIRPVTVPSLTRPHLQEKQSHKR